MPLRLIKDACTPAVVPKQLLKLTVFASAKISSLLVKVKVLVAAVERNALDDEDRKSFADEGAAEKADALPAQMARMRAEAAASFMLMVS